MEETRVYTDDERYAYVELARVVGINEACRRLGYPSVGAGCNWMKQFGVRPPEDSALMRRARQVKEVFGKHEKMVLLHELLEAVYKLLDPVNSPRRDEDGNPVPWLPSDLKRMADTAAKVMQTMELLDGRATERQEIVDPTDVELRNLIEEFRTKNDQALQDLR